MSELFNYLALLLVVLPLMSYQERRAEANVPKWILSMASDSKNTSTKTGFSNILSDENVSYIGYVGADYQEFSTDLQRVQRINDSQYDISGITVVKNNRYNFRRAIDVTESKGSTHPTYGVDDPMKGQFTRRGYSIVKYSLEEETSQMGSGVFTGYLLFYWYETSDGKSVYDNIDSHSDSYCGNQYTGTWKSNRTKKSKPCAWG